MRQADWRPSASIERLRRRAAALAAVRAFFSERSVLEVDTPLIGAYPSAEPHLGAVSCRPFGDAAQRDHFLQTSPESALKRLLAAGSGPIYQLGRAFRAGELGSRHQPEFTMLEWYRPGWSLEQLRAEVHDLVSAVVVELREPTEPRGPTQPTETGEGAGPAPRVVTYEDLWRERLGIDPHTVDRDELAELAIEHLDDAERPEDLAPCDRDTLLGLLMSQLVEPSFDPAVATYVFDFPACQAAMAACEPRSDGVPMAKRFELYLGGFEIANAYWELTDADEQHRRLTEGLRRQPNRSVERDLDQPLIDALRAGLPPTSGVALGFDRLLMAALDAERIQEVITFPIER